MNRSGRCWMTMGVLAVLTGCALTDDVHRGSTASGAQDQRVQIAIAGPVTRAWSSAAVAVPTGGSFVAVTSEETLEFFHVDPQRAIRHAGSDGAAGFHPDDALAYDWTGDGVAEVLVAGEGEGTIQLWVFDGVRLHKRAESRANAPRQISVTDLDGDGYPDVVVVPYSGSGMEVHWGDGVFVSGRTSIDAVSNPAAAVVADWTGDGRPDILWGDRLEGTVRIARNLGNRQFEVDILYAFGAHAGPRLLAASDVNGDGAIDLVAAFEVGGGAAVLYGDGRGNVIDKGFIESPGHGFRFVTALARENLLAMTVSETGQVILVRPDGRGGWLRRALPHVPGVTNPRFEDLDGDGVVDLVAHSLVKSSDSGLVIFWGPLWEGAEPIDAQFAQ